MDRRPGPESWQHESKTELGKLQGQEGKVVGSRTSPHLYTCCVFCSLCLKQGFLTFFVSYSFFCNGSLRQSGKSMDNKQCI